MVKDVVENGDQPQESKTWIGHFSRTSTSCLDPLEYWTGILKSSTHYPVILVALSVTPGSEAPLKLRQCA
jgi:hypothetical protein